MAAKTRQQIQALAMHLAGVTESADADFVWKPLINLRTDEIARETKCLYTSYTEDIVSGQATYCASLIFKLRACTAVGADGVLRILTMTTPVDIDSYGNPYANWRTNPATGNPVMYIAQGANTLQLYPVPNYNSTAGLTMEGLGVPGATWDADTATCPLPESVHDSVAFGAAALYCYTLGKGTLGDKWEKVYTTQKNALWATITKMLGGARVLGNSSLLSEGYSFTPLCN